ncbi:glucose-6-phosphate dehydrogenase [Flavisolibacter nicotianae]|uniref:glucose-6-phosphate dehydrogenase n=1 Tax=Flavisolibacter nicotianae TaxID=2364882 RepID=UPI0019690E89|nr:glucose-6-phosphate dehydrogenase [Flavisolibacter nicotianae]
MMDTAQKEVKKESTVIFIFGGSGDLAHRKLLPALYNLFLDNYLPENFFIVGIGRTDYTDITYRTFIKEGIQEFSRRKNNLEEHWRNFSKHVDYLKGDLSKQTAYQQMAKLVKDKAEEWKQEANAVFYMSVAPQMVPMIAEKLHQAGLTTNPARSRMVFEKPFGHDLKSAKELNIQLGQMFEERQIYRIDHFLGKETVQNILALRFANALFEPVWNSNYIDHVQITAAEAIGIEGRGSYYEGAGALRDMVQNHILQMVCMIAMEAPVSFAADEIRNKKLDVLKAIRCWRKDAVHRNAVRGQYSDGWIDGEKLIAYRQEKGVAVDSPVETFAAVKFYVDNWRWKNVPFYVRTGKAMTTKTTLIVVQFKPAPHFSFPVEAGETWRPNRLVISIQPQMDIRLRFQAKQPGPKMVLQPVDMVFNYTDAYGDSAPEAYETLLQDVIEGNPTLFMRADQVERAWEVIQPILDSWQTRPPVDFPNYTPGSWGPEDAEALIAKDGRHWTTLPKDK